MVGVSSHSVGGGSRRISTDWEFYYLRQENQTMKIRLATLERRCKELLVHQGAVTSSASVALSGLGSRFEQLLEQLTTSFDIADTDLQVRTDCD